MNKIASAFLVCALSLTTQQALASAADVYVTSSGAPSGVCTTGVKTPVWFNTPANWGAGSTQIGAGTVVHLCGTFTAPAAASSYLQFQGSGASGKPITLLWDTGAIVQSPVFGSQGAIDINNQSWLVLDGGKNGIVQNTDNGTNLTNHTASTVLIGNVNGGGSAGGTDVTIKHLALLNAYVHVALDHVGTGAEAIRNRGSSNFTVGPGNTFRQCSECVLLGFDGGESNLVITGNDFAMSNQAIEMGPNNTGVRVFNDIRVDHNTYVVGTNWDDTQPNPNNFHHNFFHPFTNTAGSSILGTLHVYANVCSGAMDTSTSFIFLENDNGGSGGTMGSWYVFDNTFDKTDTTSLSSSGLVAVMPPNGFFFNNTLLDAGGTGNSSYTSFNAYGGATGWTVANNVFSGGGTQIDVQAPATVIAKNNVYFGGVGTNVFVYHSTFTASFSAWQSACSCDSTSVTGDPLLTANLSPAAGSSAIDLGMNLTSVSIPALDVDILGNARPATGQWTAGAYQYCGAIGCVGPDAGAGDGGLPDAGSDSGQNAADAADAGGNGVPSSSGCSCDSARGDASATGLWSLGIAAILVTTRRRARRRLE